MDYDFTDLHERYDNEEYTRSYDTRYTAEIKHIGLGTYRVLKDLDEFILDNKVEAQFKKWDEQWFKIVTKSNSIADKEANLNLADEKTLEAKNLQLEIENLLLKTLDVNDTIHWDDLKDFDKFRTTNPKFKLVSDLNKVPTPSYPTLLVLPKEPEKSYFEPTFNFLDNIFSFLKERKIQSAEDLYKTAIAIWKKDVEKTEAFNKKYIEDYEKEKKQSDEEKNVIRNRYEELEKKWKVQEEIFYKTQAEHNQKIDVLKEQYLKYDKNAVIEYCELVLNNSAYPITFPKDFELDYDPEKKSLIVEYILPSPSNLPTLMEVKYIATKKELKEIHLTETQVLKNYDNVIYKTTLRTIHELLEADQIDSINELVFNGWVSAINKATGKQVNDCIVSIKVNKKEFLEIQLSNVDPKTCFNSLNGIASAKLSNIIGVKPINTINKGDKRFTS